MVRYMHLNWIQLQRRGGAKEVERSVYSNYLLEVQASCLQHKIKKMLSWYAELKRDKDKPTRKN